MSEKDCREVEFNTYCIFTQEKQDIEETMEKIFKDYIEKEVKQKKINCAVCVSNEGR